MGETTEISWTDSTFNPWTGCAKVSPGCEHCYAETLSKRGLPAIGKWGVNGTRLVTSDSYWKQPVRWNAKAERDKRRHRVFCASLADVFEARPDLVSPRHRLFDLIRDTPGLDWLLLTKRPENIRGMLPAFWSNPNVWVGTTVENQDALARIPQLALVSTPVRFLSVEPLLGPIDFGSLLCNIQWTIIGGESGRGARRMDPAWVDGIIEQCDNAGVAMFFKQTGEVLARELGLKDTKGGDIDDPNFPARWKRREFPVVERSS